MVNVPVKELVYERGYYPRQKVNFEHVQRLADALEAGAKLPPIIIWGSNRKIVDGCHRTRAVEKLHGPDAEIPCIEKEYANLQEFFLDSVRYNSEHGLALNSLDRQLIGSIGDELKIDPKLIARAMRMTTAAAGVLKIDVGRKLEVRKPKPIWDRTNLSTTTSGDHEDFRKHAKGLQSLTAKHCAECRIEFAGEGDLCPRCDSNERFIPKPAVSAPPPEAEKEFELDREEDRRVSLGARRGDAGLAQEMIDLLQNDRFNFRNESIVRKLIELRDILNAFDLDEVLK